MTIPKRVFRCLDCGKEFEVPFGKPRWLIKCPSCGSENIVRVDENRGWGGRFGFGWGKGRGRGWGRGRGRGWGWRFRGWEEV